MYKYEWVDSKAWPQVKFELWKKMNTNMNAWSLNGNGDVDVKSEGKFKFIFSS